MSEIKDKTTPQLSASMLHKLEAERLRVEEAIRQNSRERAMRLFPERVGKVNTWLYGNPSMISHHNPFEDSVPKYIPINNFKNGDDILTMPPPSEVNSFLEYEIYYNLIHMFYIPMKLGYSKDELEALVRKVPEDYPYDKLPDAEILRRAEAYSIVTGHTIRVTFNGNRQTFEHLQDSIQIKFDFLFNRSVRSNVILDVIDDMELPF